MQPFLSLQNLTATTVHAEVINQVQAYLDLISAGAEAAADVWNFIHLHHGN